MRPTQAKAPAPLLRRCPWWGLLPRSVLVAATKRDRLCRPHAFANFVSSTMCALANLERCPRVARPFGHGRICLLRPRHGREQVTRGLKPVAWLGGVMGCAVSKLRSRGGGGGGGKGAGAAGATTGGAAAGGGGAGFWRRRLWRRVLAPGLGFEREPPLQTTSTTSSTTSSTSFKTPHQLPTGTAIPTAIPTLKVPSAADRRGSAAAIVAGRQAQEEGAGGGASRVPGAGGGQDERGECIERRLRRP